MFFVKPYTLLELSYILNARMVLRTRLNSHLVHGVSDWFSSTSNSIVVLNTINKNIYLKNNVNPVIVLKDKYVYDIPSDCLVVKIPRLALAKLLDLCKDKKKKHIRSKNTVIDKTSKIASNVKISSNVNIKKNVVIGDHTYISNNVIIKTNCIIGNHCYLGPNVILYENTIVGNHSYINANSIIASDGFGFVLNEYNRWKRINHFGRVIVGNYVNIGCNTTIDRGVLNDTIVDDGTVIDNQVQIGHNVFIGKNVVIAGCTGIGGSSYISNECIIGGGVMISDHIYISKKVYIAGTSTVTKSINNPGIYSSVFPVKKAYKWNKLLHYFFKLNK